MSPQSAPTITPRQMNVLRIVAAMAWSDGHLAQDEMDLMLDRFSQLFATDNDLQQRLKQELRDYMVQNLPLDQLIPKLSSLEERELVLKLGYEVINASSRTPDEPKVNAQEANAYQQLVQLLALPTESIQRIEAELATQTVEKPGVVDTLVEQVREFFQG